MAKVKITGHASGTGTITLTAPNTSTDRIVTLPDGTGTLLDENSSLPAANLTGTVISDGLQINHAGSDTFSTIIGPLNRDLRFDLRNNSVNDGFTFRNAAEDTLLRIDAGGHVGIGYAAVNGILDVRESWASKWAARFENTSTTGLGILGITAATDGLYNLLELRKNTTEVVLKIRADGKAMSQFTAAGWVSIDGVGTVGINDSYNISSITDNGVGLYTINIDTNMLNGDYCVTAMCQGSGYSSAFACLHGAMSAGSFPIRVRTGTDAAYIDADEVMLTIFGDQ
jgi:hypothetical protein